MSEWAYLAAWPEDSTGTGVGRPSVEPINSLAKDRYARRYADSHVRARAGAPRVCAHGRHG